MKRINKHVKETAKSAQRAAYKNPAQELAARLASTGLYNPLSIALAEGAVQPVPRRGRPRTNSERDEEIVCMKDAQGCTFGEIARKLKIGREVAMSAYYRMKRNIPAT